MTTSRRTRCTGALAAAWLLVLLTCGAPAGRSRQIKQFSFAPVSPTSDVLTPADVDAIVQAAAESNDAVRLAVAVTDRIGNVLRVWNRSATSTIGDADNEIAVSLARTAAYLSHSQAPLTSRTGQFISTHHFPSLFSATFVANDASDARLQSTLGVRNTPQGPLWQIDASQRGAPIASTKTSPPTAYDAGKSIPQLTNPDGSTPSPGITPLPGAVPLYKRTAAAISSPGTFDIERRLVGAVGVYATDGAGDPLPDLAEFAAYTGSLATNPTTGEDYTFGPIPFEGAVYLVGILLPYLNQTRRPSGFGAGAYDAAKTVVPAPGNGSVDPSGWLISPRASASAVPFAAAEVRAVIDACVAASRRTHAAIRLPAVSECKMVIAVTDSAGVILGAFRMEDATLFSLEISISKARNAYYYSHPGSIDATGPRAGRHPLDGIVPAGTAITARTLGFLSQPFYPPGFDKNSQTPGPLYELALENRKRAPVARFNQMGHAPPATDDTQSGVVFFPGSAPLYRDGTLIGGVGVSGDGVEQDDLVTARAIADAQKTLGFQLEPPAAIRCDNFVFKGVRLPYFKFPQNPDG